MSQFALFEDGEEESADRGQWQGLIQQERHSPNKWVVVHNDFVLARVDWTINMNRIFAMLVSQISMDDEEFTMQRIRVRDLRDLAEVSSNNIHNELADAAQSLIREPIEFRAPDNNYEGYSIFTTCKYLRQEGVVAAKFNEDARPYLLQLRESFTRYKLRQVMKLSTSYAVRFYQIAKMIQRSDSARNQIIDISSFRKLFMLEAKYERHADLVNHVIKPSVKEVNDKTDAQLRIETIREGNPKYGTPKSLKWTVWPCTETKKTSKKERPQIQPQTIADNGDSPDRFDRWFENLPKEQQSSLRAKAREKVIEEGRNPDAQSFEAYLEMKLREMTKSSR